jgi:hypothetical protein
MPGGYYHGLVIAIFVIVLLDLLFDAGIIGRG